MGQREFLGMHSAKVKKFGDVSYRTYEQVNDAALRFGASLRSAGLVSSPEKATLDQLSNPCTLAIFENTCPEWAIGEYYQSNFRISLHCQPITLTILVHLQVLLEHFHRVFPLQPYMLLWGLMP